LPKIYPLDRVLSANTVYEMEKDRYYVIKKIGTNISADVTPRVDGAPCGKIITDIAPLYKTSSNLLGPLDLGLKYIVVPPERKLDFYSTGSGKVRIIGDLVVLSPGEPMLSEHAARYAVQDKDYVTHLVGSYSVGTGVAWPDGVEYTVFSLTPATIEEYIFKGYAGVSIANLSAALAGGQVGIRFFLDGKPLDTLLPTPGPFGIDALSMPLPPTTGTEMTAFSLEAYPIDVLGDHTLEVKARNVSGGSLSPATGTSITITFRAIAQYMRKT
jgi:hypothetical protein